MGRWRRPHSETLAELQTWIPSRQWRAPSSLTSPPLYSGSGAGMTTTLHSETQAHPPVTAGGRRWVPVSTGTTGGGGAPTNDGRRRAIPQSSFPRRRESTRGAAMGSRLHGTTGAAATHKRREAAGDPTIVIPARRETTGGGGAPTNDGGGGRSHNRHSRDGGNPQRGAGDGFPSPRERRWARQAHPQTTGGGGRSHNRHSRDGGNPQAGGRRWVPVSTGTTGGGGAPTNDGRRRAIPQSSFPRRRESTERGPAMGSRLHAGTTDGRRQAHPHNTGGGGAPTIARGREKHSSHQL